MELLEVNREALDGIEGWLADGARIFTQYLIAFQRERHWISGVLELGVFKGKYLSLLAQQSGPDVPIVGVDAFLQKHGVRLNDEYKGQVETKIRESISSVAGTSENVELIAGYTSEVSIERLRELCPAGYSFISVDAGHDSEDVEHDSGVADALLSDQGAIAFDDIYNAACPGVAEGFIRYMIARGANLAPFATCGNKVFVCRTPAHADYYAFADRLARDIKQAAPQLSRTLDQLTANEANNWSPRLFGHKVIPFL